MAEYLTELAYRRWYDRYQVNHLACVRVINTIQNRMDVLPQTEELSSLNNKLFELEKRLEAVNPRNFSYEADPLVGIEKFIENIQVLLNLIRRTFRKNDLFSGIYQSEMNRVLILHEGFKIKEALQMIDADLSNIEEKNLETTDAISVQG